MTDFLLDLLAVTLGGSFMILLLLLLAWLGHLRYGAKWRCFLWLLLCLRMAVPGPILPVDIEFLPAPVQLEVPRTWTDLSPVQSPQTEETPGPVDGAPDRDEPAEGREPRSFSSVIFILWIAGDAAVRGWNLFCHGRFLRTLHRESRRTEDPDIIRCFNMLADRLSLSRRPILRICPGLPTPMLVGLCRPMLLLPARPMKKEVLTYAILHELMHYRDRHIWIKALVLWVCALHWFNPLVWLMARAVEQDTELACDEGVLAYLPKEEYAAYSRVILAVAAREEGVLYEN